MSPDSSHPSVVIVSPALAGANNGNWQTARRWASFLTGFARVRIVKDWPGDAAGHDDIMIALHARRSAPAIHAWARAHGPQRLAVVLTGTDLYRDIRSDAQAQHSLDVATRLVVLQELGIDELPAQHRSKARVIYQSVLPRKELPKSSARLRAVMVGHMRDVKSPQTLFDAARLLRSRDDITIRHIGRAEDEVWARRARETVAACPNYEWLGPLPHGQTRGAIQRAHVLVHASAMEGGAHVIMEAVCSGTPVVASRVAGNVGMLGTGYEGYFEHGDAAALARMLAACRDSQAADDPAHFGLARLRAQCAQRAPLFAPEAEQRALQQLIHDLQEPT
jgi:putative glycosyltransferase (TIGR04348 family)